MALTTQSLQSDQLVKQRKGYIAVSFTEWTTTSEDLLCAGSSIEASDTVYYATGDEDIDSTNTLAGLGNGTIVYVYFTPATNTVYCSGSAPAWDDAKQGWYLAASPTHRCILQFLKVGAGNYTNKIIPISRDFGNTNTGIGLGLGANADRTIQLATDASILWDESEDGIEIIKRCYKVADGVAGVTIRTFNGNGADATTFIIKKPITCNLTTNIAAANAAYIQALNNANWSYMGQYIFADSSQDIAFSLNPGKYRIYHTINGISTLSCIGVYGISTFTAGYIFS